MNLNAMLVVALLSTGAGAEEDRGTQIRRFQAVHGHWRTLHQEAAKEGRESDAILVIDPEQRRFWIQHDPKRHAEPLPEGMEWVAFHVTARGIREIEFPIQVRHFRLGEKNAENDEQIWVIGSSKTGVWNCSVSSGTKGHIFTHGTSGPISSVNLSLPASKAELPDFDLKNSFAIFKYAPRSRWSEHWRKPRFTITVTRLESMP